MPVTLSMYQNCALWKTAPGFARAGAWQQGLPCWGRVMSKVQKRLPHLATKMPQFVHLLMHQESKTGQNHPSLLNTTDVFPVWRAQQRKSSKSCAIPISHRVCLSLSLCLDVLHRPLTLKSSSGNFLATSRYATPKEKMCRSLSDSLRFSQLWVHWGQGHHLVGVKVSGPGKLLVTVVRKQRKNKKMKAYESEQRLHLTLPGYCFASFLAEDARQRRRWRDEKLYLNEMATWQWDCFVVWRPASVDATSLILTKPLHRGFNHSACVRGPPIAYQERFIEDVAIRIPTCSDTTPVQSLCTSSQQAAGNSRYCLQNHQRRSECVNEISLVSLVAWKSCLWWSVVRSSVIRSI